MVKSFRSMLGILALEMLTWPMTAEEATFSLGGSRSLAVLTGVRAPLTGLNSWMGLG